MEEWKDIYDYEGAYQISNLGRVRSLPRKIIYSNGKIIHYHGGLISTKERKKDKYWTTCLCKNQIEQTMYIHRLVALHFIPNPKNKPEVNHKDGDKSNNKVTNLEWATESENNKHAHEIGLNSSLKGADSKFAKLTWENVFEIRRMWESGGYTQTEIADIYNVGGPNICNIVNFKTWKVT